MTTPVPTPPMSAGPSIAALDGRSLLTADIEALRSHALQLESRLRDPALRRRHVVVSELEDVRRELARRRDADPMGARHQPRFGPAAGSELATLSDQTLAAHEQWLADLSLRADPSEFWISQELEAVRTERRRRSRFDPHAGE